MDNDSRPTLAKLLIASIPFRIGAFFVVIGLAQLMYFVLTGAEIFEPSKVLTGYQYTQALQSSLGLAGFFCVIGGGTALFAFVKSRRLTRYGIVVVGNVDSVGTFQYRGMKNISYSYSVDNRRYERRSSVAASSAENFRQDSTIKLFVDAKRPQSHVIL